MHVAELLAVDQHFKEVLAPAFQTGTHNGMIEGQVQAGIQTARRAYMTSVPKTPVSQQALSTMSWGKGLLAAVHMRAGLPARAKGTAQEATVYGRQAGDRSAAANALIHQTLAELWYGTAEQSLILIDQACRILGSEHANPPLWTWLEVLRMRAHAQLGNVQAFHDADDEASRLNDKLPADAIPSDFTWTMAQIYTAKGMSWSLLGNDQRAQQLFDLAEAGYNFHGAKHPGILSELNRMISAAHLDPAYAVEHTLALLRSRAVGDLVADKGYRDRAAHVLKALPANSVPASTIAELEMVVRRGYA